MQAGEADDVERDRAEQAAQRTPREQGCEAFLGDAAVDEHGDERRQPGEAEETDHELCRNADQSVGEQERDRRAVEREQDRPVPPAHC